MKIELLNTQISQCSASTGFRWGPRIIFDVKRIIKIGPYLPKLS